MLSLPSVVVLLIGCLSVTVVSGLSWQQQPEDQVIAIGGNVTFRCEIKDGPNKSVIWLRDTTVLFSKNERLFAPDRYSIVGKYNLVITNVQKEDNMQFTCNVKDLGIAAATLTVLLPPGAPSIKRNFTGNPYRENQVVSFTCESNGGNPPPTIRWLKNGQEVINTISRQPSTVGGLSSSQIVVVLEWTDHQANYTCVVYNDANKNNPFGTYLVLSVQYSPHISFKPYSPYNVHLDTNAELICDVAANPAVSQVIWTKDGQQLPQRFPTLVFKPTRRENTGNYTCTASNNVNGPKSGSVKMNVVYPPIINIPALKTVRELDSINIKCVTDANPPPYQVFWKRVSGNQTLISSTRDLIIEKVLRGDAGNYTCEAWSQMKVSGMGGTPVMRQNFLRLYVEYAPGSAFIKPVGSYNVGDRVELKCSASQEGYPKGTYEWKKESTVLSSSQGTYVIEKAQLSDNGQYTCTPKNKVGRGSASKISLTVNEPPIILQAPPPEVELPLTDTDPPPIECQARGRPSPRIQWFKDDDAIPVTSLYPELYYAEITNQTVDIYSFLIKSVLHFKGPFRNLVKNQRKALRVEDMGNYTCKVDSVSHPEAKKHEMYFKVQFQPRVRTVQDRVAVNMSRNAELPCIAQAFPDPKFQWYRNGQELIIGQGRYSKKRRRLGGIAELESVLMIQLVTQQDLGKYTCYVSNVLGNISQQVTLTKKSIPEAPRKIRFTGKTWESVALEWEAGFDGGYTPRFFIRYSVGQEVKDIPVIPPLARSFNITQLTPSTSYVFNVFAKNAMGSGNISKGLLIQTNDLQIPVISKIPLFDASSKKLAVSVKLDSTYCLRIQVRTTSEGKWETVNPCLEMTDELVLIQEDGVIAMNVSVCLKYRYAVCGSAIQAEIRPASSPGLTERDVIIIACVCAVIIVTLLTILVCFIFRRRRNRAKDYESEPPAGRPQPVNGSMPNMQKPPSYDNAGMTNVDAIDLDDPSLGGAFASQQNTNFTNSYGPLDLKKNGHIPQRSGHMRPNGNVPHDTSYDSQHEKQMYENEMNRRNEQVNKGDMFNQGRPGDLQFHGVPRSPTKEKYIDLEEKKDPSLQSGQESGYSTPDPAKPKKVIYEVVV